jgi:hypothetical protein
VLAILFALSLVACGAATSTTGWTDPGAHIVDGYWVGPEASCPMGPDDSCTFQIAEAKKLITPSDLVAVVGAVTAPLLTRWIRADGNGYIAIRAGLGSLDFVILDLGSGRRRAFVVFCSYPPSQGCQQLPGAASDYRVGTTPTGLQPCGPATLDMPRC